MVYEIRRLNAAAFTKTFQQSLIVSWISPISHNGIHFFTSILLYIYTPIYPLLFLKVYFQQLYVLKSESFPIFFSFDCPVRTILLVRTVLIIIGERYELWSSSLSLIHSPFSSLNTLNLHSFLNIRDPVPQLYDTTGIVTVLYVLILEYVKAKFRRHVSFNGIITPTSCCKLTCF